MGQIIHPDNFEYQGPWLLDRSSFLELEKIISSIKTSFQKSLDIEVEAAIKGDKENEGLNQEEFEKEFKKISSRYPFDKISSYCYLKSKGNTKLAGKSISEVLKDPNLISFTPKEFYSYTAFGNNNKFTFDVNRYSGRLTYELNCYDQQIGDELKDEVNQWIEKYKPNSYLTFWTNWGDLFAFILPILFVIFGVMAFFSIKSGKDLLKEEAVKLIEKGVDSANTNQAIELILKIQAGYKTENLTTITTEIDHTYLKIFIFLVLLFLMFLIRPKTTLGVGRRVNRLKFYKFWIKFITITLPSLLIISPFTRKIQEWWTN